MSTNLWPFKKRPTSFRCHAEEASLTEDLAHALVEFCKHRGNRDLLLICIGTDRSTGDSLGPLVGNLLEGQNLNHFHVHGTLAEPIHAANMEKRLASIYKKHPNAFVVALDACLGKTANVGYITLSAEPLKPGAAMGKNLPEIGDICLTGIVNVGGLMDFYMLQSTRLHVVMSMAQKISKAVAAADQQLSALQTAKTKKAFSFLPTKTEPL